MTRSRRRHGPPRMLLLLTVFLSLYITTIRDDAHLVPPSFCVKALTPRSASSKSRPRETRYFTEECLIPPLQPLDDRHASNGNFTTSSLNSDKIHLGPLPVVYTNNPKTLAQWLAEHIPSTGHCTIGFDLEVRTWATCCGIVRSVFHAHTQSTSVEESKY